MKQNIYYMPCIAGLAQLVEHLICNQRVVGSSPTTGTRIKILENRHYRRFLFFYDSKITESEKRWKSNTFLHWPT